MQGDQLGKKQLTDCGCSWDVVQTTQELVLVYRMVYVYVIDHLYHGRGVPINVGRYHLARTYGIS